MKAIVQHEFGPPDVLELREVDEPVVDDDEVLVRVHAGSVNPADWHRVTGTPYIARLEAGLLKPKRTIAGSDMAGRVEAVGQNATRFRPGDEVFGEIGGGAFAEYVCVAEDEIGLKPTNLTFEQAAAVPMAAITALQGLRDKGKIQPGQSVLINGASGGVGTFAVQIAKALGAEVTGVCSTRNVDMVRSLGADHVVDYTRDDFAGSGPRYDVMLDNVGNRSLADCRRSLNRKGIYILVGGPKSGRWLGPVKRLIGALFAFMFASQKAVPLLAKPSKDDLVVLRDLVESGKVVPVIDRHHELSEVPEALRYLEQGHARGKIVITL